MIALSITEHKSFMTRFLTTDTFDRFRILEAVLRTNVTFSIDCHLCAGFYSSEELSELDAAEGAPLPFSALRSTLFSLIRGTHTPVSFQFVLMPSEKTFRQIVSSAGNTTSDAVSDLFLNLRYQEGILRCTTGVSYRIFTANREADRLWDAYIKRFLTAAGIIFEEIG